MLFHTPVFLFGFLPLALLGFWLAARAGGARLALAWLLLASLAFYGWWDLRWLPLMLGSIAFNLVAGRSIASAQGDTRARAWLTGAIVANLMLLLHYKYSAFLVDSAAWLLGTSWAVAQPELPLGISFFTFTQIAFLVDVHQRKAADFDPLRYGLFVTYFPHLIAGPLLHHREMMPQFERPDVLRFDPGRLADGSVLLILGLFKKTVLADAYGTYANPTFAGAGTEPVSFFAGWGAALSYTLQLYFDFSGYSDMAIGLALMIGIRLPINFHSPYKATDIADFWRRWHMTLSRFLRDYLYIPLGGSRRGPARRMTNLLVTMLLGGLWHGAGWTFVIWGGLHGICLVVHRLWQQVRPTVALAGAAATMARAGAWLLTFAAVVVGWVFFRSHDLEAALAMLRGMAGLDGSLLPLQMIQLLPWLGLFADGVGKVPLLADGSVMGGVEMFVMIVFGLVIVTRAPAMHELSLRARYLLVLPCGALALQRVLYGRASEFLYFQF